ncbi:UNVERIFIED_CONTAM: hypothetical protein GTU68_019322 [Idotea baltica]|nr:hypothetical protein [Idotea baltica]
MANIPLSLIIYFWEIMLIGVNTH